MKKGILLTLISIALILSLIFNYFHFDFINSYIKKQTNEIITLNNKDFLFNPLTFSFYTNSIQANIDKYKITADELTINPFLKTIKVSKFYISAADGNNINLKDEISENIEKNMQSILNKTNGYSIIMSNGKFSGTKNTFDEIAFYNELKPKIKIQDSGNKNASSIQFSAVFQKTQDEKGFKIESVNLKQDTLNLNYIEDEESIKMSVNGKNFLDILNIIYKKKLELAELNNQDFVFDFIIDKKSQNLDGNGRIIFQQNGNNSVTIKSFKTLDADNKHKISINIDSENLEFKTKTQNNSKLENEDDIMDIDIKDLIKYFYGDFPLDVNFDAKKVVYGEYNLEDLKIEYEISDNKINYQNVNIKVDENLYLSIQNNAFKLVFPGNSQSVINILPIDFLKYLNIQNKDKGIKISGEIYLKNEEIAYQNTSLNIDDSAIFFPKIEKDNIEISFENTDITNLFNIDVMNNSIFNNPQQNQQNNNLQIGISKILNQIISFIDRNLKITMKNSKYSDITINNLALNIIKNKANNALSIGGNLDSSIINGSLDSLFSVIDSESNLNINLNSKTIDLVPILKKLTNYKNSQIESLDLLNGNINIKSDTIKIDDQTLSQFNLNSSLTNGVISLTSTSDKLNINANGNFKSVPTVSLSWSFNSFSLNEILGKICQKLENKFSGTLNGTAQISSGGETLQQLLDNLSGTSHTIIQNSKIKNFSPIDLGAKMVKGNILKLDENSIFDDPEKSFATLDGYVKIENKKLNGYLNLDQKIITGNITYEYDIPSSTIIESKGVFVMSAMDLKSKNKDQINIFVPFALNGQCTIDDSSKLNSQIDTSNIKKYFDYIAKK